MPGFFQNILLKLSIFFIEVKWKMFEGYNLRLAQQGAHIYRTSDKFRERWQVMGLDYAQKQFDEGCFTYFKMAQKMPFGVKLNWFIDAIVGYESQVYDVEIIFDELNGSLKAVVPVESL